jgi:phosphate transport system substrate-binding protein
VSTSHLRRFGALAIAAGFAVAACTGGAGGQPSGDALSGTITIDGSSTVYPITEIVAEEFQLANSGVQVPVAFSGTGGGFKKFCAGETDINDASRPIKADDGGEGVACETNDVDYVELQVAIDGLTVVVNPDNAFVTCLTVDELVTIYGPDSPKDLLWSDVNAAFPAEAVERFMPGADSGTFDYFTEEINGEEGASRQDYNNVGENDNATVTGVGGAPGGLGYFGFSFYQENEGTLKALEVDGGEGCVAPSAETAQNDEYVPLSRPLLVYPSEAALQKPEVKAFVDFYLANVNELAEAVGFIPLTDEQLKASEDATAKLTS